MKKIIRSVFTRMGFTIQRIGGDPRKRKDAFTEEVIAKVQDFTMTDADCISALIDAVNYLEINKIEGDFVECGVWKGGSILTMIETLKKNKSYDRSLYLYDTFEGMSEPTVHDKDFTGEDAANLLSENKKSTENAMWAYAPFDFVKNVIYNKGYPDDKIKMTVGKVEDTIPGVLPGKIALLRLDTDFYESTRHELEYLFPLLVTGGILIIDDYGCWQGARKAVDEYFEKNKTKIFLSSINWTAKIAIKQ